MAVVFRHHVTQTSLTLCKPSSTIQTVALMNFLFVLTTILSSRRQKYKVVFGPNLNKELGETWGESNSRSFLDKL